MEAAILNYILVETFENNERHVTTASEIWIQDGILRWPPKGVASKRKKHAPPENDWASIKNFRIMGVPHKSLKAALAKEKIYESFSNTESEQEQLKQKERKRKHPVLSLSTEMIDENDLFDEIENKNKEAEGTSCDDDTPMIIIPPDLLNGNYSNEDVNPSAIGDMIGMSAQSNIQNQTPNNVNKAIEGYDASGSSTVLRAQNGNYFLIQEPNNTNNVGQESVRYMVQSSFPAQLISNVQNPSSTVVSNQYPPRSSELSQQSMQFSLQPTMVQCSTSNVQNPSSTVMSNQYHPRSSELSQQPMTFSLQPSMQSLQPMQLPTLQSYNSIATDVNRNVSSEQNSGNTIALKQLSDNSIGSANICTISENEQVPCTSTKTSGSTKATTSGHGKINSNGKGKENINSNGKSKSKATGKIQRKTKSIGKLNSDEPKSVNIPKKTKKVIKSKVKEVLTQQQPKLLKKCVQTTQESCSTSTQGALVGYINNFVPSPTHSVEENYTQKKYLPLIYKEILEFKNTYMADRLESNKRIDNIDKKVENIDMKVSKMEQRGNIIDTSRNEIENLFADESILTFDAAFPKTEKKAVKQLEVDLKSDPVYHAKFEFRLKSLSNKKPRAMVRAFMRYIICDSVLQKYSWKGRTKLGFHKLKTVCNLILAIVQTRHKKYTKTSFDKYMGTFIKLAKSRWDRKENQRKRSDSNEIDDDESNEEDDEDENDEEEDDEEEEEEEGSEEDDMSSEDDD